MYEGESVTREDIRLFGQYQRPLPEYLDVESLPAAEKYLKVPPEERRRRVAELKQKIRDGVVRIQQSPQFREYLIAMSRFHAYSWHNQLLIMLQRPDATLVRGFQGWREMERYVKQSEKGIRILAPAGPTSEVSWVRATDGKTWHIRRVEYKWVIYEGNVVVKPCKTRAEAVQWLHDQGAVARKAVIAVQRFVDVAVFDVKQTEGKPLPEFEVPVLTGEMNKPLFDTMLALMSKRGVSVSFESRPDQDPGIKGQFHPPNSIWVRPEEPPAQQLKTLLHEGAHYYTEGPFQLPRADAETIAESAAFVVGAHHGFDTGVRSFPYVALWAKDEATLNKNLDGIHKVSEHMIEELEETAEQPPLPITPMAKRKTITVEEAESKYSAAEIQTKAKEAGINPFGASKRDLCRALIKLNALK